jgi:[ribosomal protein S18]-alanine N-acetyltransferase
MNPSAPITIRTAAAADLDRIMQIENQSFLAPWSELTLENQIVNSIAVFLVAEVERSIIAFSLSWVADTEVHLLKLAVDENFRRRHVGYKMLDAVMDECADRGGREVFLEVRRQNIGALYFYKNYGFLPVGVRKRYYSDTGEDAIVMRKEIC